MLNCRSNKSDEKLEANNFCESAGGGQGQNAVCAVIDVCMGLQPLHPGTTEDSRQGFTNAAVACAAKLTT